VSADQHRKEPNTETTPQHQFTWAQPECDALWAWAQFGGGHGGHVPPTF